MLIQLVMPQLGESVVEGTITKWLVRAGDTVAREQVIVEVATDKADSEVPSTASGRIVRILVNEGQTVKIGSPLCEIEQGPAAEQERTVVPTPAFPEAHAPTEATPPAPSEPHELPARPQASPLARKLAREGGVDFRTLEGSGARGRITPEDVRRAAEATVPAAGVDPELVALLNAGALVAVPNVGFASYKVPPYALHEGDRVVPFSRRRRLTAHHMVYSKLTAPHVVTVAEVDLHRASLLRDEHKDRYKNDGVPLTMLAFVCQAIVRALREYPTMNARVLEDAYVLLRDINLGIAVDASDGLIVPNVKRADELSLRGLAKAIDEVARRARDGRITADDLANSTFSVSNPGLRGNLFGGAILAQPNVGILRMGEIKKRVVVLEIGGQDVLAIHPVMYLALSYDHRVVDGVLGNSFLFRVREILENAEFEV